MPPDRNPEDGPIMRKRGIVGEDTFFGIGSAHKIGWEIVGLSKGSHGGEESKWTKYEPFRFSVEFWGVEGLKEKQREYSRTVFYAGNCLYLFLFLLWRFF